MMLGGAEVLIVLIILFFLVLAIGAGVAVVAWFAADRAGRGRRSEDDALEILRRRYARGEITREEFNQMQEEIRS